MNIFVTLDPKEILDKIGKEEIEKYISKNWKIEDVEKLIGENRKVDDLWDTLESAVEDSIEKFVVEKISVSRLLKEVDDEDMVEHLKEESEYFISGDIEDLIKQINDSGCIDDVIELFSLKYTG